MLHTLLDNQNADDDDNNDDDYDDNEKQLPVSKYILWHFYVKVHYYIENHTKCFRYFELRCFLS